MCNWKDIMPSNIYVHEQDTGGGWPVNAPRRDWSALATQNCVAYVRHDIVDAEITRIKTGWALALNKIDELRLRLSEQRKQP